MKLPIPETEDMKSMRIPLLIIAGVAILGLILGSFFDLQISQGLGANAKNMFPVAVSAIVPTVGFAGLAMLGGGFLALALKKGTATAPKVFFLLAAIGAYGASVYFAGVEYFGVNGFNIPSLKAVGFLIAAVPLAGAEYLGYRLLRNVDHPKAWVILLVAFLVAFVVLVPGATGIKAILHRPRYRSVVAYEGIEFHNWWQSCKNYRDLMETYQITSEEFKSFPSGHTAEVSLLLLPVTFFPMLNKDLKKFQLPCLFVACLFLALTAISRILAAAHFLSDVSMGLLLMGASLFAANEILIHIKSLHPEEPLEVKTVQAKDLK